MTPKEKPNDISIAIIHDRIPQIGGGERFVFKATRALNAPVYMMYVASGVSVPDDVEVIPIRQKKYTSGLSGHLLEWKNEGMNPLETLSVTMDLSDAHPDIAACDVLLESAPLSKAYVPTPGQTVLHYPHSPPRWLYDLYRSRLEAFDYPVLRFCLRSYAEFMRSVDKARNTHVDRFVANSELVGDRIRRFYGREADVVYPPVTGEWRNDGDDGYFVTWSRLIPEKRIETIVEAFAGTIVFARILDPGGFGGYYLLLAVSQLATKPVEGIAGACKKRISEAETDATEIYGLGIAVAVAGTLVTSLIAFVGAEALISYTGLERAPFLFVCLFAALAAFALADRLVSGLGRFGLTTWIDLLLLGALLSPAITGQYEVAFKLTVPATLISAVATDGLMSRVSNRDSKDLPVAADITNTLSFSSLLSVPLFFGAAALATPLVVTAYGAEYAAAAPFLIGLAAYRVVQTQARPLVSAMAGLDAPEVNLKISTLSLLVNVVLGVLLIRQYGGIGVVFATIAAELLRYALLRRTLSGMVTDVEFVSSPLLTQFGAGLAMYAVVAGVHRTYLPIDSWLDLLLLVGLGGFAYGSLLLGDARIRRTVSGVLGDAGVPSPSVRLR